MRLVLKPVSWKSCSHLWLLRNNAAKSAGEFITCVDPTELRVWPSTMFRAMVAP